MRKETGFFWLKTGSSGGIFEPGNEPSDSITGVFQISNRTRKNTATAFFLILSRKRL
jgi:hypothetical protein